jgi:protein-ribulosamine 3-kinase
MIPDDPAIRTILSKAINGSILSLRVEPVGGGSINQAFRLSVNRSLKLFCKLNSSRKFPSLFEKEKRGLESLASHGIIRIPKIFACEGIGENQVLIMEWIEQGTRPEKFWRVFGEKLASLHQITNDHFGWVEDNYMGALHQSNKPTPAWTDFFFQERLEPQIRLAADNNLLSPSDVLQFNHVNRYLSEIFPQNAPALLHGDLWSGNFLCDEKNEPVLIDPAVYFGHPGMDLGTTTLFGGFEQSFYQRYAELSPFASNYQEQWDICKLYPLLIHLNLFGRGYLAEIVQTLKRY